MALLLTRLRVTATWTELLKRALYDAFWKDNCLGLAAQLAYYFFFALFPALLFLVALASYFPLTTLIDDLFRTMGGLLPPEALQLITNQMIKISNDGQGGLLTLGVLLALSSSSAAMVAIIDTLNRAYGVEDGRPWWKVRLAAIALTVGIATFILISFALVLVGPTLATALAEQLRLGPVFEWTWKILQWPVLFGLTSLGIALIYYFAPDVEQQWIWLTPGALLATTLWLAASLAFKYYVANWGSYTETYGLIGAVMILLFWFYISGLVLLIGAELNAALEHASPIGKAPGEKVPGQKQRIPARAMRRWKEWRQRHGKRPPSASDVTAVVSARPSAERTPAAAGHEASVPRPDTRRG
ncbi:MAG: YihY/virulence factor BrkB family protein [Vicinamibacterales bacterium]